MGNEQKNPFYIGVTIKRLRKEKNIIQEELCFNSKLNRTHLGRLENNRSEPLFTTIIKLANGFGLTYCDFIKEIDKDKNLDNFFNNI